MFIDILKTTIINAMVLLSVSALYSILPIKDAKRKVIRDLIYGVYISIAGIMIMSIPFDFQNGVIFDTRSILLTSTGIFIGGIPTVIAIFSLSIYRLSIGGIGMYSGIIEIIGSGVAALLFKKFLIDNKKVNINNILHLFSFTMFISVLILLTFFVLPEDIRNETLPKMWPIILFIYPLFSMLIYSYHIRYQKISIQAAKTKQTNEQYKNLFEHSHVALLLIDDSGYIVDANKTALEFYGWTHKEITLKKIQDINTLSKEEVEEEIKNCLNLKKEYFNFRHLTKSGKIIPVEVYSGPIQVGERKLLLSSVIDATDKIKNKELLERQKEEFKHLSYHDYLTGLYNRLYFEDALNRLTTSRKLPLTILLGDVDNLKEANDEFSHLVGDELLKEIAHILKKSVREEEIIARWGGDEFAILLPNTDEKVAKDIIKRINHFCEKSTFTYLKPSISFGYHTKTNITGDLHDSVRLAEVSMYEEKNKKKQHKNTL